MPTSNRKGVSVLGATAIVALLIVAMMYGVYTIGVSNSQVNLRALENLAPNVDTSTSSTPQSSSSAANTVLVYGNATFGEGGGECGGAFSPTGVEFLSSQGVNYTAKYNLIGNKVIPPSPFGSEIGNYSINLPGNDQYKVYIIAFFHCSIANPPEYYTTNCPAGTLNLTIGSGSEEVNVACGQNPIVINSSTGSATTSTVTETTTSVNTQVNTTCENS